MIFDQVDRIIALEGWANRIIGRRLVVLVIAVALGAGLLVVLRPDRLTIEIAILAAGVIFLGALPGILYLVNNVGPPMPLLGLTGAFYLVFFCVTGLRLDLGWWTGGEDGQGNPLGLVLDRITVEAMALVFGGLGLMILAFYGAKHSVWRSIPHLRLPEVRNTKRLLILLWALLIGHFGYSLLPFLHAVPSVGQFLRPAGYLAFGMFYLLWAQGTLPRIQTALVFFVALPLEFIELFSSGLLTLVMLFGIFMVIVIARAERGKALSIFLGLFLLIVAFYPAVQGYRVLTWGGVAAQSNSFNKARIFVRVAIDRWRDGYDATEIEGMIKPLIRRAAHIVLFAYVVEATPEQVPYLAGATYHPFLTSFIPRALWPGKPEERLGQEFGHRYRILLPEDRITSINVPWIVEMYVNFGALGVLLGMAFAGVVLAALERLFNSTRMSPLELVTGLTIFFPLFHQESNVSVMMGSLLPLAVAFWVYFRVGLTVFETGSAVFEDLE